MNQLALALLLVAGLPSIAMSQSSFSPAQPVDSSGAITKPFSERASDPATCVTGQLYKNTVTMKMRGCVRTNQWMDIYPNANVPNGYVPSDANGSAMAPDTISISATISAKNLPIAITAPPYNADPTGVADSTAAIIAAWQAAALSGAAVTCPSGTYKVSQIAVTRAMGNVEFSGPSFGAHNAANGCILRASGTSDLLKTTETNVGYVRIKNVIFDLAYTAASGIYCDTCQFVEVDHNYFIHVAAGSVAYKMGGGLYNQVHGNNFSGAGMGLDWQNSYSSVSRVTYYGCNVCFVGTEGRNSFNVAQGNRVSGIVSIANNGFEGPLNSGGAPAILEACDPAATGIFKVFENYFELSSGTQSPLKAIEICSGAGTLHAHLNAIYGPTSALAGGLAISAGNTYSYPGSIRDNVLVRWETGIDYVGTGSGDTAETLGPNSFQHVINEYSTRTITNLSTAGNPGQWSYTRAQGFHAGNAAISGSVARVFDGTTALNLSLGNTFSLQHNTPATIASVSNANPGMFFTVVSTAGNATLPNSVFHLRDGHDLTLPANGSTSFYTDSSGVVREVGVLRISPITVVPSGNVTMACGGIYSNASATSTVGLTLPDAAGSAGCTLTVVTEAREGLGLFILAGPGRTIRIGASVSASGGNVQSMTIGNAITLTATSATTWVATSLLAPVTPWTVN